MNDNIMYLQHKSPALEQRITLTPCEKSWHGTLNLLLGAHHFLQEQRKQVTGIALANRLDRSIVFVVPASPASVTALARLLASLLGRQGMAKTCGTLGAAAQVIRECMWTLNVHHSPAEIF